MNLPLSSYAQNNAVGQDGNGYAEQKTGQSQSSEEDGQVISGDSSILSGNNLLCQDQENSDITELNDICETGALDDPTPNFEWATLKITTIQRANCNIHPCPSVDGEVTINQPFGGLKYFYPTTQTAGGKAVFELDIPVGYQYSVSGSPFYQLPWYFKWEGANIQNERNSCSGWPSSCSAIMPPDGASVIVNFHYRCVDTSC